MFCCSKMGTSFYCTQQKIQHAQFVQLVIDYCHKAQENRKDEQMFESFHKILVDFVRVGNKPVTCVTSENTR